MLIHAMSVALPPNSVWIVGTATLTMDVSSTVMNMPTMRTRSGTTQCWTASGSADAVVVAEPSATAAAVTTGGSWP